MASVDVPVALLGYGTVGSAVNRLLNEQAGDIERATGHRLRVVKALVRDLERERGFAPDGGVLTTEVREITEDPGITIVAEVMGGVEPAGEFVLELLRRGKHVVTANKQLVARRGAELFDAASSSGVQLRFEASVCAAIPVIKVLRESLVVTNVHRVLGIVNGTTNFMLTEMEGGATYEEALREAQARGFAEADPTDDVSGADAAAKMAILATVAFNSRYSLADVEVVGIDRITPLDVAAARELDMVIRLVGMARLLDGKVDVRVGPALVDRHHPLAAVEGAFNAVMLQGDAIREITLEGPGAGGIETASAVIADMASVIGTMGTGFLQNDPVWRNLPRLATGENRSPFYFNLSVVDRPGVLARVAEALAEREVSVARLRAAPERRRRRAPRRDPRHVAGAARGGARRDRGDGRGAACASSLPGRLGARSDGARMGLIDRYRDRLPVTAATPVVTLGEGSTPLIPSRQIGPRLGVDLHFKYEGMNPTGSFKDRGMTVAVSKALEAGADGIVCASTGNTAASAAAYGARAGLTTVVLCPAGAIAIAKLAQSRAVGARVLEVRGSFDEALTSCLELVERGTHVLVNSLNPDRIEGQKTAAFEIDEALGRTPDVLALPYGGGGNTVAYAKGFAEDGAKPRLISAFSAQRATTLASAIRIAEPAHLAEVDALAADGSVEPVAVTDEDITRMWLDLASLEGIFCEPSSAAGLAALSSIELEPGSTVVCVLTGHGLKDTAAVDILTEPAILVEPTVESILAEVSR